MDNLTEMHLSGGIFFALIMESVKPRSSARLHLEGNEDVVNAKTVLESLFKIANPSFTAPRSIEKQDVWRITANKFKSCTQSSGADLIIYDQSVIDTFNRRMQNNYSGLLAEMSMFVENFIDIQSDTQKYKLLLARLLYLIEKDDNISPEDKFIFQNVQRRKADLVSEKRFYLDEFLLAVWHYTVSRNIKNSLGKKTYDIWWPSQKTEEVDRYGNKKRGGGERLYSGEFENYQQTTISVEINKNKTSDTQHKINKEYEREEVKLIEQAFLEGFQNAALRGFPGSGKNYIAKSFANTHKDEFPVIHTLRLKRTSDDQTLCELIISALHFNDDTVKACLSRTLKEQFEIKLSAINSIQANKLFIVSGLSEYNKEDIDSLSEISANFILCTERSVLHNNVKEIPVKNLTMSEALNLFEYYNAADVDKESLKVILRKIDYHVGTIVFMAKLMKYHSLTAADVLSKLNSSEINELKIPSDAGAKMISLLQYHQALFSFDTLNEQEDELLLLFSLMPNKDYDRAFLAETFSMFNFNYVIALSLKGYIEYDPVRTTIKCSPFISKTYLKIKKTDVKKVERISGCIKNILIYDDCKEFSSIEAKIIIGDTFIQKLQELNIPVDGEIYLQTARGFQLLCQFEKARKYADRLIESNASAEIIASAMHLRTDILIFCFDYESTIDLLQLFIGNSTWAQLTPKRQGELLYKLGVAYSFSNTEKCWHCFKKSFQAFQKDGIIVGELISLLQLIMLSKNKRQVAHEMKLFRKDSDRIRHTEPIWKYFYYIYEAYYKFFSNNNIRSFIYYGNINDLIAAIDHNFFKQLSIDFSFRKVNRSIQIKAKDGGSIENAFFRFFNSVDKNKAEATYAFLDCYEKFMKLVRIVNIPVNSEIIALSLMRNFVPKEFEILDHKIINEAVMQLFFNKYNQLLPTHSQKLLASTAYAEVLISCGNYNDAVDFLNQQIRILFDYLPQENLYPLITLLDTLAACYDKLQSEYSYQKKYVANMQQKKAACWEQALKYARRTPNTFVKQAELLYHLNKYNQAIKLLEQHNCTNCTLCHCYLRKIKAAHAESSERKNYIRKILSIQTKVALCGPSCRASKWYEIGNIYANMKKPVILFNWYSFIIDKTNKKGTNSTAFNNCSLLSNYYYKKRMYKISEYFLKNAAKFAIKSQILSSIKSVYITYFMRADLSHEAAVFKSEMSNYPKWLRYNFLTMARYYYGRKDVNITDIVQLVFDEINNCLQRISSVSKGLHLTALSRGINGEEWWYINPKWEDIKKELRINFFTDLLFSHYNISIRSDNYRSPFLIVYELAEKIESLLKEHNICSAEDIFFEAMDTDSSFNYLPFGIYFYQRLNQFSDQELAEANFSREEILEGESVVRQRYNS